MAPLPGSPSVALSVCVVSVSTAAHFTYAHARRPTETTMVPRPSRPCSPSSARRTPSPRPRASTPQERPPSRREHGVVRHEEEQPKRVLHSTWLQTPFVDLAIVAWCATLPGPIASTVACLRSTNRSICNRPAHDTRYTARSRAHARTQQGTVSRTVCLQHIL
jgi:hypothetical protein